MEKSIAVVTSSVSRNAGGLYDSIRSVCLNLYSYVEVFGLEDRFTNTDISGWGEISINSYRAKFFISFGYAPFLWRDLADKKFDLIHLHGLWMYPQLVSLRWQIRFNRPVIISVHGMLNPWAVQNSSWKKKLVRRLFADKSLRKANCLHALGNSEYQSIRNFGLNNPIAVIPNGIILPHFEQKEISQNEKNVLLYLGRLHPIKGLELLIRSIALLKQKNSDIFNSWHIKIVGKGSPEYEYKLKREAETYELTADISFTGALYNEDKIDILSSACGFILPSYSEGLPMSVLEAWSYKLPVLMTEECSLPEGFTSSAAIRLQHSAEQISQSIESFISLGNQKRKEMGQNGFNLVRDKFNWRKIAMDYENTYKWLIEGGQPPECIRMD